ncbi:MAG: hypothetical protein IKD37_09045 [Clostridia bacterium]|nr:hypothetical protein [Clostridia bacterium]
MDNNQAPKFDPETGRPLNPQPAQPTEQPAPRFDTETGLPLDPPPAQPQRLDSQPEPAYTAQQEQPAMQAEPIEPAPAKQKANGMEIGSLICGIATLVCCCCTYLSIALGIVAVILAVLSKQGRPKMSGMALGGMICGIIGGGIALISIILGFVMNGTGMLEALLDEFSINHGYEEIIPEYTYDDFNW